MGILVDNYNVSLKIIGSGSMFEEYKKIIKNHNIEKYVEILPPVNDTKDLLLASDIYFLLSEGEGFPLGLLEAMSCGIPSIISNLAPFDEIDDQCILRVNPKSPGQIKDAIECLMNLDNYNKISLNSRNYVIKNHTWEVVANKYLEVINS